MPRRLASILCAPALVSALAPGEAPAAWAQTFTFASLPPNTTTPFTLTRGGLTAAFTAPTPTMPGAGVFVGSTPFDLFVNNLPLTITFSAPLSAVSFLVSLPTAGPENALFVELLRGGAVIQTSITLPEQLPNDTGDARSGTVTLTSATPFQAVRLTDFAMDGGNREVGTFTMSSVTAHVAPQTTVPEPHAWALLGTGLLAMGRLTLRRRARTR